MLNCAYCQDIAIFECSKDRFCIRHTHFHTDVHRTNRHNMKDTLKLKRRQKKEFRIEMHNRLELLRNCKKEIFESAATIIRKVNLAAKECIKKIDKLMHSYLSLVEIEELDRITGRKIEDILASRLLKTEVKPFDASSIKAYYSQEWFEKLTQSKQWKCFIERNISKSSCIKLTNDEEYMITGHMDNAARIWNISTENLEGCLIGHTKPIKCLNVSRDNEYIVSGSFDRTIRLWNMQTKSLISVFKGHLDEINSVDITSDNAFVVSLSYESAIKIWNAKEKHLEMTINSNYQILNMLVWDKLIIAGKSNGSVKLWRASNKTVIKELKLQSPVVHLAVALKTDLLAIGCNSGSITLYDLNRKNFVTTLNGSSNTISSISLNSSLLVECTSDQIVLTWDLNTFKIISKESVKYSCNSTAITSTNKIFFSDMMPFRPKWSKDPNENKQRELFDISKLRISIDRKYALFYCSTTKEFHVWRFLEQKSVVLVVIELNSFEISEDSKIVVAGGESLIYWKNFRNPVKLLGHSSFITCVDITYDKELIVSGSMDKTIRIFNLKVEKNSVIKLNAAPVEIKITRNKLFIVYCVDNKSIRVHNILNNYQISELILDHGCNILKISKNDRIISTDVLYEEENLISLSHNGKLEKYETPIINDSIQLFLDFKKFIE